MSKAREPLKGSRDVTEEGGACGVFPFLPVLRGHFGRRTASGSRARAMDEEFREIDEVGSWSAVYQEIRQQSSELPCKFARSPENKCRNRYRDVSPFDHSRILLQLGENDYINASLISMEEAQRNYILTQGPLPNTCGHFWEMVWEQRTRGVVMLNRVIEKGSIKCAQYWPHREERDAIFEDTNFRVTLVSEDVKAYYTVRQLELENLLTQETREILHFHYTTWPDFGVPESPASFLHFLFKVRESGCLHPDQGPVVVHCSAGIGRSGTFCLVDTCLVLVGTRFVSAANGGFPLHGFGSTRLVSLLVPSGAFPLQMVPAR
ncbi:Tyrosine-protein phosphatase non-receptor type 1 [Merluccius polli]|uniref:protein-tyrosine-phosphatase n=1 Tax=Merluccius polli TaxID=89951 RepID=A0AA47N8F6_MERPO|nr:Tyrosine-protein phosphatase non-receptor type 1 [Merluccius polli]